MKNKVWVKLFVQILFGCFFIFLFIFFINQTFHTFNPFTGESGTSSNIYLYSIIGALIASFIFTFILYGLSKLSNFKKY
jgi:TRAP-type mannitol/chloroaromatic compound transport system permease small subunit